MAIFNDTAGVDASKVDVFTVLSDVPIDHGQEVQLTLQDLVKCC